MESVWKFWKWRMDAFLAATCLILVAPLVMMFVVCMLRGDWWGISFLFVAGGIGLMFWANRQADYVDARLFRSENRYYQAKGEAGVDMVRWIVVIYATLGVGTIGVMAGFGGIFFGR